MVQPYYSAKRAHVWKPLSLSPNDSVAAVTLENETLLYAFFIAFTAVMARVFTRDLFARVVSQNLRYDGDSLQATKCAFLQPQTGMTTVIRGPF